MKKLIGLLIVSTFLLLAGCPSSFKPPAELNDKVWISPSKVEISNFHPGARAEYQMNIHNGNDKTATFSVTYRQASDPATGYVTAPDEVQDWVIIADPTPVLAAKETRQVLVAVEMPEDATAPPKWEFGIAVKDTSQTAMIQTELVSRWLVTMK
jgi:hypothetical protein